MVRQKVNNDSLSKPALVITRVFDAPRELVFEAMSKGENLAQWWGPAGFELEVKSFAFEPGGIFHYVIRSSTMGEMWARFKYLEIDEPGFISYISSFSDPEGNIAKAPFSNEWPMEVLNSITLIEEDGKTRLTLTGQPINANEQEYAFFEGMNASMQQGFGGTFQQLDEYLRRVK